MRRVAVFVLFTTATSFAQSLVSERRLGSAIAAFEDSAPAKTLNCSVSPIKPQLNYGFRFQAGFVVTVPMNQFQGPGHRWRLITRVTPDDGERRPVYLMSSMGLPPVPATKVELQVGGGYLLGEGKYSVRQVLQDETGRTCRRDWRVEVRRGRGEDKVKVAMPPGTVLDVSLRGSRTAKLVRDDARPMRLTIMLHAAPTMPRRTRLRTNDILTLLASVSSVIERVPTTSVRLVAFNLDQQRELYRRDGFVLADLPEVADAMTRLELGLVDAKVLQNRRGHVETIAGLVNGELTNAEPSDAVIFLGPISRFDDKLPAEVLERPSGRPQFLFFQLQPVFRGMMAGGRGLIGGSGRGGGGMMPPIVAPESTLPDSIRHAVSRLGGKTMTIRTPGELAKAIDRLEQLAPAPRTGASLR
jgi:hypothetical protein